MLVTGSMLDVQKQAEKLKREGDYENINAARVPRAIFTERNVRS
jgi:hypothetical protein